MSVPPGGPPDSPPGSPPGSTPDPSSQPAPEQAPHRSVSSPDEPRRRLLRALVPRGSRGELLAGLLCAVLGFALVVQVRQTQEADLGSLRETDLVRILDDLGERNDRLESEQAELARTRDELRSGTSAREAARQAAQQQVDSLGILAGTAPAQGPGIRLTITDPGGALSASTLLDAVQELRDSGAETIQVDDVRVVASTSFTDTQDGVAADGTLLQSPYDFLVIGDPQTLDTAMRIPGGVESRVASAPGARFDVRQLDEVLVDALRVPETPQYARPAEPTATP